MMLKKIFRTVDRALQFFEEWSLFIAVCAALLTAMANVVLRKTTDNYSLYWSDEVVRKVIYFSTYIGCVAAIRSRSLIRIDALPQIFTFLTKPLALVSHLAVLLFAGIMIYLGREMTMMMYQDEYAKTATLRLPEWPFYAVLPLMGVMMMFRTLITIWEDIVDRQEITGDH